MPVRLRLSAAAVLVGLLASTHARAEWTEGGSVISPHLYADPGLVLGADGRGGAFGANRADGMFPRLYRLDASGDRPEGWPLAGIELLPGVSTGEHASARPIAILPDGEGGGYFLTRQKSPYQGRGDFWHPEQFFVHRRDAGGNPAPGWTVRGVRLATPYLDPRYTVLHPPVMVPDERGGVLVAWIGQGIQWWPHPRVAVQRVTREGAAAWGVDGVTVHEGFGACTLPALVADGTGGALVFWGQWDPAGTRIRMHGQHVSPTGDELWEHEGRGVSSDSYDRVAEAVPPDGGWVWQHYSAAIAAIPDGAAGAILAWAGTRGAGLDVMAMRVAADGRPAWADDVVVCGAPGEQASVSLARRKPDGAIVAWSDGRLGGDVGIFAQAIDREGRARWTADGLAVAIGAGARGPARVVDDGREGAYFAWTDSTEGGMVSAQRLLHSGRVAPGWTANGTRVALFPEPPGAGSIGLGLVEGRDGSAIVAWWAWGHPSYAMLLAPHGIASSPGRPIRDTARSAAPSRAMTGPGVRFGIRAVHEASAGNPATVSFSLPEPGPASLELYDVAGRRVWARELSGPASGERRLPVAEETRLPRGLYFARLVQGARAATTRVLLLR